MAPERRRRLILAATVAVLALVVYRISSSPQGSTSGEVASTSNPRAARGGGAGGPGKAATPDVHLEALDADRPKPAETERNLFQFKTKPPPLLPPKPAAPAVGSSVQPVPAGPLPTPPLPPIPYKFIGVLEQGAGKPTIAVLSDTRGNVFHGVEGETVEGRYKILRVGVESIEMSYLDGRGRQTIRLTG